MAESKIYPYPNIYTYLFVERRSNIDKCDVTFSLTWEYFFPR